MERIQSKEAGFSFGNNALGNNRPLFLSFRRVVTVTEVKSKFATPVLFLSAVSRSDVFTFT